MKAINDAIYTKVTELTEESHNAFYNSIGGRFYYQEAPQSVEFPYSVYYSFDENFDWNFSSGKQQNVLIQISCYSKTRGAAQIESIRTNLLALFEYMETTLEVEGFTFIYMKQVASSGVERVEGVWNYNIRYEVEVESS